MENPISSKARGVLYVIAVVVSGLGVVAAPIAVAVGLSDMAIAAILAAVGAVSATAATLARANLTLPGESGDTSSGATEQIANVHGLNS